MFNFSTVPIDWPTILPVILLSVTGLIALTIEMLQPKRNNNAIVLCSVLGLLVTGALIISEWNRGIGSTLGGMVLQDTLASVTQLLVVLATLLAVLFSEGYLREKRISFGEFYPLLLWSAVGAMVMSASNNLLLIFLGLEILSISLYVLAGLSRNEQKSEESALKYFLLGSFSTGFLLYGIAFLYGASGSLDLGSLAGAWQGADDGGRGLLLFGTALLLVGLCFKASFVPFHQWTPDVYQGAPTNVAAFMAAGSKIAAFAVLFRFLEQAIPLRDYWMPAMSVIAILTMTIGNLVALIQTDVKRVLGYSSIAHAGYILVAILAHCQNPGVAGVQTLSYYLLVYTLMTVGAFAVISMVAREGSESTKMEALHGLWHRSPLAAGALVVFMISLIGIPPTAGFFGKYFIFRDALDAGLPLLAIVLAVNSVLSIAYYLGIARAVFVTEAEDGDPAVNSPFNLGLAGTCVVCTAGIVAAVFFIAPFFQAVSSR